MGGYVKRPSDAHPQLNLQARVLMKYGARIVVSGRPPERREKQRRLQLNADPRLRLLILSGMLLLSGLLFGHLTPYAATSRLLLTAGAVAAGSSIAIRAWNALRTRHISIELLVTVATIGALLIGEYVEAAAVTLAVPDGVIVSTTLYAREKPEASQ